MSRVKNTIDKFGRSHNNVIQCPPGIGFKLNASGHYDLQKKRLTNISGPTEINDAATKRYVDKKVRELREYVSQPDTNNAIMKSYVDNKLLEMRHVIADVVNKDLISYIEKRVKAETSKYSQDVFEYVKEQLYKNNNDISNRLRMLDNKIENVKNENIGLRINLKK